MTEAAMQENRMGYMPEGSLLLRLSLPIMFSMCVQALYNVVDSLFVARLSEDALTAVSLAFPILNVFHALSIGAASGINALLSKRLGEKNLRAVNLAAGNGILTWLLTGVIALITALTCTRLFYETQAGQSVITELGVDYTTILLLFAVFPSGAITFERLLVSTGKSFYSMLAQAGGSLINIVFDPIMIFGLFGCPAMGIKGAALATVMGQALQMGIAIYFNLTKNREINFSLKYFHPDVPTIKSIYAVGIPVSVMCSIGSFMVFGFNKILLAYSSTAAAVLGVYFKLQSFIFMPIFGLNQGMIPIIAYNYGARKPERMLRTLKLAVCTAVSVMFCGLLLFEFAAPQLLKMFAASDNMLAIGTIALRKIGVHFPLAGACIVIGGFFQALGDAWMSMINSITRQLVFLLPSAYILSLLYGLNAVWWAFAIAEIASLALTVSFLKMAYARRVTGLKYNEECKMQSEE